MRISTLLAATAALTIATSASAAVSVAVYSDGTGPNYDYDYTLLGQTLFADFESEPAGLSGDYAILAAPGQSGVSAAPSGTPAGEKFLTVPYDASSGTATFDMANGGKGYTSVSFYWGSIDAGTWNTLDVLGANGSVLATITGDQLPLPVVADGNQTGIFSNFRVNFSTTDAGGITGFRYSADRYAFETDTYAVGAAVPEPATWGLMILGFGMIGAAMRRRQKVSVTYA